MFRASARVARALWIAWAVIVWSVVFDHVLVVAGRSYIVAAGRAAVDPHRSGFPNMDDWMRPAVARGLWIASGLAGAILVVGLAGIRYAARAERRIS